MQQAIVRLTQTAIQPFSKFQTSNCQPLGAILRSERLNLELSSVLEGLSPDMVTILDHIGKAEDSSKPLFSNYKSAH